MDPKQIEQIKSWSEQRDALLLEISVLEDKKGKLLQANKEIAQSNSEIEGRIARMHGKLEEEERIEKIILLSTSNEIAELKSEKAVLESEVVALKSQILYLADVRKEHSETIQDLADACEHLKKMENDRNISTSEMARLNTENVKEAERVIVALRSEFEKILTINSENVEKTNKIINELPKMIFDLQKSILERRHISKVKAQ